MDWEAYERLETLSKTVTSSVERGLKAGLCSTCANATLQRRQGQITVTVYCSVLRGTVPSDIEECSSFEDPTQMTLHEMKQVALDVDGRRGVHDKSYI